MRAVSFMIYRRVTRLHTALRRSDQKAAKATSLVLSVNSLRIGYSVHPVLTALMQIAVRHQNLQNLKRPLAPFNEGISGGLNTQYSGGS